MADWYLCALRSNQNNRQEERVTAIQYLSDRFIYLGLAECNEDYNALKDLYYETLDLANFYRMALGLLRFEFMPELTNSIEIELEKNIYNCSDKKSNNLSANSLESRSSRFNDIERFQEWKKTKTNRLKSATSESFKLESSMNIEDFKLNDLLDASLTHGLMHKVYLCAISSSKRDLHSRRGTAIGMLSNDCFYLGNANYDQVEDDIGVIFYQILDLFSISKEVISRIKLYYLPKAIAIIEASLLEQTSARHHPARRKTEQRKFERWIALRHERRSEVDLKNDEWKQELDFDLKYRKICDIY